MEGKQIDTDTQKAISIESTQEAESNLPSVGCRIRMLVGYDGKGIMNVTIITPKETVDYQYWYSKRNKVINKYKYIKDNYSWNDEVEFKSDQLKAQFHQRSMSIGLCKRNQEQQICI